MIARRILIGLAAALVVAASPASAEEPGSEAEELPFDPLDAAATDAVRVELNALAQELTSVARGESGARAAVIERARVTDIVSKQVEAFQRSVASVGEVKKVRFTGMELRATTWFGIVPVQHLDLSLHLSADGKTTKLLRVVNRASDLSAFGPRGAEPASPELAGRVGTLVQQVLDAVKGKTCARLPLVTADDLPKAAAERSAMQLRQLAGTVRSACHYARKYTWHRVTGEPAGLSGIVEAVDGKKYGFRMQLGLGDDGQLQVARITRPLGTKTQGPGAPKIGPRK